MTFKKDEPLSVVELLVRQVSALVSATADVVSTDSDKAIKNEVWLYRNLAQNCQDKADMLEDLWKARPRDKAASPTSDD
jgi:hypothetical protein